jgi:hypothetical protein
MALLRQAINRARLAALVVVAWLLVPVLLLALLKEPPASFTVAQLHYGGGGDWYANPSSLPNLLDFIRRNTRMEVALEPARVAVMDNDLFAYPMLYMTGHGNVRFTDDEARRLRLYLESGGFLHADDNYGMDESFRREMALVFSDKDFVELPFSHGIYHSPFEMGQGLPKVHEHDNKPPKGLGIYSEGRLVVFYSYESDLGDGWEDQTVHNDTERKRQQALRMGVNIVQWALTH